ncbi:hypothetical protein [Anaerotignum sp. MB30-C6]|uniref:hypothetical protein n=1 Tax=Anaerotignum sp. MB30-C6 TaxID=3070814 RepID=UPI0027DD51AA|nr:hypothetical protein [Anaerotignum sp. MB30-C6]WMI81107.1 hypothetical protein RBQ60_15065 [Anaerotignum sp. MB30-C6]
MKIAEVRYLEKEEQLVLPRWTSILTEKMRSKYILSKRPFTIHEKDDTLYGVLSFHGGQGLPSPWREKAEAMVKVLAAEGAGILIAPYEGEIPHKILPVATGKILAALFAFDGAAEALRRQGKNPEEAHFLIAGNDMDVLPLILAGMGDYVNHLSFFVDNIGELEGLQEELYIEKGLLTETFSSPKNPLFTEADAIIVCGMEQTGYEHILKRYAVYIDAVGNRPALRRLSQRRWDVAVAEGFYFHYAGQQLESRRAEAVAFISHMDFRGFWLNNFPEGEAREIYFMLKENGFSVSGFSALGKRVKIAKNQG